jgi:hypothetical protein
MEYSEEILKQVTLFGALQYPAKKIISILNIIEIEDFFIDFTTPGNIVFKAYWKGFNSGSYNIDSKLFEAAQEGDIDASKELRERQSESELNTIIKERFNI